MSWKDLYSEVKKRKMETLNKKDVVKAVERHGKILAVNGRFEKPKKVIEHSYAAVKKVIKEKEILKENLSDYDVILIGCPGSDISPEAHPKIQSFVNDGGWLITTDWALNSIIELLFFGYIRWNRRRTDDVIVTCQIQDPSHPFLEGVASEMKQDKWRKESNEISHKEFRWWLENRSFPIQVLDFKRVRVLISSNELQMKWGESPVLVEFNCGDKNGKIIHMISHSHLQKGGEKGKYVSALILTNILDEKVSQRYGLSERTGEQYSSDWVSEGTPTQTEKYETEWVIPQDFSNPAQTITPTSQDSSISQILTFPKEQLASNAICTYCGEGFLIYEDLVYSCKECGVFYHKNCLDYQMREGVCKKCQRVLLW